MPAPAQGARFKAQDASQVFSMGGNMGKSRNAPGLRARIAATAGAILLAAGAARAAHVLVINGNSNNTVTQGNLSLGDAYVKQRLETALHHKVRVMWDQTAGTATYFTPDGLKLFDAAVAYGLGESATFLGSRSAGMSGKDAKGRSDVLGRKQGRDGEKRIPSPAFPWQRP